MKSCKLFQNLNLLSIFRSNLPIAFQAREHQRNTFEYLKCKPSGEAARRIFPSWCHSQYWTGDIGSPNADYEPPTRQDGPSVKREIVIQSNCTRNKIFDIVSAKSYFWWYLGSTMFIENKGMVWNGKQEGHGGHSGYGVGGYDKRLHGHCGQVLVKGRSNLSNSLCQRLPPLMTSQKSRWQVPDWI